MSSGSLRLFLQGEQDAQLYGTPSSTFFNILYKKNVEFYTKIVDNNVRSDTGFGKNLRFEIPSKGDLVKNIFLRFVTSDISSSISIFSFYQFIEHADLIIGGQVIERLTGEYMFMILKLIGYPNDIKFIDTITETNATTELQIGEKTFLVPLPFYFYKNKGNFLPIGSLHKHEVEIEVKFFDQLNQVQPYPELIKFVSVPIEYVVIDENPFINYDQTYTITQVNREFQVIPSSFPSATIDLSQFKNPTIDLFTFVIRSSITKENNQIKDKGSCLNCSNEDSNVNFVYNQDKFSPIKSMELTFNGVPFIQNDSGGLFQYQSKVNPVFNYNDPTDIVNKKGCVYTFGHNPLNPTPSGGHINFSRIIDKKLKIDFHETDSDRNIKIYSRSFNILRVSNGLGGLMFSHHSQYNPDLYNQINVTNVINEGILDPFMTINGYGVTTYGNLTYQYFETNRSNAENASLYFVAVPESNISDYDTQVEVIQKSVEYKDTIPGLLTFNFTNPEPTPNPLPTSNVSDNIPELINVHFQATLWKSFTETFSLLYSETANLDAGTTYLDASLNLLNIENNLGTLELVIDTTYGNTWYNVQLANLYLDYTVNETISNVTNIQSTYYDLSTNLSFSSGTSEFLLSNVSTTYLSGNIQVVTFNSEFKSGGSLSNHFENGDVTIIRSDDLEYASNITINIQNTDVQWIGIVSASLIDDGESGFQIEKSYASWNDTWSYKINEGAVVNVTGGQSVIEQVIEVGELLTIFQPINGDNITILNINTNIGTLTFDNGEQEVGETGSSFRGESIFVNPDRSRIYLGGRRGGNSSSPSNIYQYTLNSTFDFSSKVIEFTGTGYLLRGLVFSDDGLKVFYSDGSVSGQVIYSGTLGTAWDISTLSGITLAKNYNSVPGLGITGIEFTGATPGTEFILVSSSGNIHYENLSTPYDLTTSTEPINTIDYASILTTLGFTLVTLQEIRITGGGNIALILHSDTVSSYLLEYRLSPAYELSSLSASSYITFKDVGTLIQDNISGISDGARQLCSGLAVDTVYSSGNYVYVKLRKANGNETVSRLALN